MVVKGLIGAALAAVLLVETISAQQNRPLPAFNAASATGASVTSDRLTASPKWLLVYTSPDAIAGQRLLRALDGWAADAAPQVVVIAAGPAASIDGQVRPLLPSSPGIAVFADVDGSVARALGLTTAPALIGVDHAGIDWIVQGVLNDPQMVEPIVRSWLRP